MGLSLRSGAPTLLIATPGLRPATPATTADGVARTPRWEYVLAVLVAVLAVLAIALVAADAFLPGLPHATA